MELRTTRVLKRLWTVTWKIVVFIVLWAGLYAPAVLLIIRGEEDGSTAIGAETRLYLEFFGVVAVLLAAWVLVRFVDRRSFRSLGFRLGRATREAGIGLGLGSAMILLAILILWAPGWVQTVPVTTFSWQMLGLMGTAMLLNSITQEVLVRGYVLQTIESEFDVTAALVVSSTFFVLLHAGAIVEGGILSAVNLFAAGWLLGLAYTTTGNLWLPFGLHFAWNVLQGPVLGITVSGSALDSGWRVLELEGPTVFTGGSFGLEGGLAATVVTVLGIAFLALLGRRRVGAA